MSSEIDFGVEVICTQLMTTIKSKWNNIIFNPATCKYREVGHIGVVSAVFPMDNCVHVTHQEYFEGETTEFTTAYHIQELEIFNPPRLIEDTPLAKAIQNLVQITRD